MAGGSSGVVGIQGEGLGPVKRRGAQCPGGNPSLETYWMSERGGDVFLSKIGCFSRGAEILSLASIKGISLLESHIDLAAGILPSRLQRFGVPSLCSGQRAELKAQLNSSLRFLLNRHAVLNLPATPKSFSQEGRIEAAAKEKECSVWDQKNTTQMRLTIHKVQGQKRGASIMFHNIKCHSQADRKIRGGMCPWIWVPGSATEGLGWPTAGLWAHGFCTYITQGLRASPDPQWWWELGGWWRKRPGAWHRRGLSNWWRYCLCSRCDPVPSLLLTREPPPSRSVTQPLPSKCWPLPQSDDSSLIIFCLLIHPNIFLPRLLSAVLIDPPMSAVCTQSAGKEGWAVVPWAGVKRGSPSSVSISFLPDRANALTWSLHFPITMTFAWPILEQCIP